MESIVFQRQLVKDFTSKSVLDNKFIECKYTKKELAAIYKMKFEAPTVQNKTFPTDALLSKVLQKYANIVVNFESYDAMFKEIPANISDRQINEAKKEMEQEEIPAKKRKLMRIERNKPVERKISIPIGSTTYLYGLEREHFSAVRKHNISKHFRLNN